MKRNYGIDLLRVVAMFLIVLHHCAYHGIYAGAGQTWMLLILFSLLIQWHVDCFLAISGWYGINFRWKKYWALWGQVAFYTGLGIVYALLFDRSKLTFDVVCVGRGWFIGSYFMLMFMAPLINAGIEHLRERSNGTLFNAWLLFAIAFTLTWAPLNFLSGVNGAGITSYCLMTMIFVYVTARVFSILDFENRFKSGVKYLILAGGGGGSPHCGDLVFSKNILAKRTFKRG